jgi:hypothetical protein
MVKVVEFLNSPSLTGDFCIDNLIRQAGCCFLDMMDPECLREVVPEGSQCDISQSIGNPDQDSNGKS